MKWGTLYSAEYVNVLYRAVKRHLPGPFRFVCLTDDTTGFDAGIESFPIPDIGLNEGHYKIGAWPKLSVFQENLYGLSGRALFIDLDTVILGDLTDFFEVPGPFVALDWTPWRYTDGIARTMSSVFAFDLGKLGWLVDKIKAERDAMVHKYGLEQAYLDGELSEKAFWPQEWVVSYKFHLRPPLLIDRFVGPKQPKPPVRLIIFHGNPRPISLIRQTKGNWEVFPHYGKGPVPWMQKYWTDNGGTL